MQDLSNEPAVKSSMWPTSQSAGNRMSSSEDAMTAPGSPPVDPELPSGKQSDPQVTASTEHVDRHITESGDGSLSGTWTWTLGPDGEFTQHPA